MSSSLQQFEENTFSEAQVIEDSQSEEIQQEQLSIITSHPQNRNQENLPIKIQVQYNRGILSFKINCSDVKRSPFAYSRHYLVFDFKRENSKQQMLEVRKQYFKHIQKGDLLMVRGCLNGERKLRAQKWIQKTIKNTSGMEMNDKVQIVDDLNVIQLLEQVYEQSKQYKDLIIVSLFVDYLPTKNLIDSIKNSTILKINKCPEYMKLFALTNQNQQESEVSKNTNYIKLNLSNISNSFKTIIQQLKKIKIAKLFFKIQTNGHIRQKPNFSKLFVPTWCYHENKLTKTIHQINDNSIQQQFILMRSSQSQFLQLYISITFFSLLGDKYITSGCLEILPPNFNQKRSSGYQSRQPNYNFKRNMTSKYSKQNSYQQQQDGDF